MSNDLVSISKTLTTAGVELSEVGLTLPPKLPAQVWTEVGHRVGQLSSASQWAVGDWWNYGEHNYGDRAEIINGSGWNGPSYESCAQYAKICRRYKEPGTRVPGLTFKHHEVVAWLAIDARQQLLDKALREKLSVQALKDLARQVGGKGAPKDKTDSKSATGGTFDGDADNDNGSEVLGADPPFDDPPDGSSYEVETPEQSEAERLLSIVEALELVNRRIASDKAIQQALQGNKGLQRRLARLDRVKEFLGCDG